MLIRYREETEGLCTEYGIVRMLQGVLDRERMIMSEKKRPVRLYDSKTLRGTSKYEDPKTNGWKETDLTKKVGPDRVIHIKSVKKE